MLSFTRIPSSQGWPLLGAAIPFSRDPISFLVRQHRTLGDVFNLDLGPLRVTIVAQPDLGLQVLKQSLGHYGKNAEHRDFSRGVIADGLVMSPPSLWKKQRKQLQPNFQHQKVEQSASDYAVVAEPYLREIEPTSSFDPFKVFSHINSRFTAQQVFLEPISEPRLLDMLDRLAKLLKDFTAILVLSKAPGALGRLFVRRYEASLGRLRSFFEGLVDELGIRPEFISEEARSRPGVSLIVQEVATLFIAGVETSATTASWGLYLLSQRPEIQAVCRDEIHQVAGDGAVSSEDLREMPRVYEVVKETLRLYPPVPLINRMTTREVQLGNYGFKSGHQLSVAPLLIQRHPALWPDPHAFQPERWHSLGPNPKGWMPFGGGPRNCIGAQLGLIEAAMLMVLVLQRFEVTPDPDTVQLAQCPAFEMVLRPREGFRLCLKPVKAR